MNQEAAIQDVKAKATRFEDSGKRAALTSRELLVQLRAMETEKPRIHRTGLSALFGGLRSLFGGVDHNHSAAQGR